MIPESGPRYTPAELARLLRLGHLPTPEQQAVIAAPVAPLLVVAGAGSGKTETMAARVVWLVANDYVRPEQVLGLTFTRKAAGELAHRVRTRLSQLQRRLGGDDLAGEPTVATYHSFAGRILTEHGIRGGFEPTARLLTEASRWQVVDALVRAYAGDMSGVTMQPATVTDQVLALAGELAEHLATPDEVARWTGRFSEQLRALPGDRVYAGVRDLLERQRQRLRLLPLIRGYEQRKRDGEAIDFGDQLSRAARIARDHPEVGEVERERFRVVLLDEYQDTSHAQVVLLHSLFGSGHPVTAVGDPCQSIYGWRGASAGALDRFPELFRTGGGRPADVRELTTSWRNRPEILAVANALAAPLRAAGARVATLTAAPRPVAAVAGRTVTCALLDTHRDEAAWIADRVLVAWRTVTGVADVVAMPVSARPTTAVLIRRRDQIAAIEGALRARGLPVEVVGLGGLLDTPEVRDVVCTLRVLADPTDGAALVRLLTGARLRIGPRDLTALHHRARELARQGRAAPGGGRAAEPEIVPDRLADVTLAEALDDLGPAAAYSPAGHDRLRAYSDELAALRRRLDQPLPDLVADVVRTTGLDVEVAVRAGATAAAAGGPAGGDGGLARAHLDTLGDVAARFAAAAGGASLSAFLAYLAAAEEEERGLSPGEVAVTEGAVQILTAHAAKGLEWDVVAVAGLTRQVWPAPPKRSDHYLQGVGVLPFPLRGDAAGLPELSLAGVVDQKGADAARQEFEDAWRQHDEREERRLAYVAATRPRRLLLCSGYWWGEGVRRPRGPSAFLEEVYEQCRRGTGVVDAWAPPPPDGAPNPTDALVARAVWPADPLGERRPALEEGAALVRAALGRAALAGPDTVAGAGTDAGATADPWVEEVALLLAERDRLLRHGSVVQVALPEHLSVSQLVALRRDPQGLARSLRRPMPARPDPYSRRGTAFHAWLEQRLDAHTPGADRLLDLDELPGAADEDAAPDEALHRLQERFLASEWADRVPAEVEVPFATVVGPVVVRGRMDAVFRDADGGWDVVDWKTGRRPAGADADAAAVQLAAYRLAWAALAGVPVARVRAAFHYVTEGVTVRPADLLDADGLTALIAGLPEAVPAGATPAPAGTG